MTIIMSAYVCMHARARDHVSNKHAIVGNRILFHLFVYSLKKSSICGPCITHDSYYSRRHYVGSAGYGWKCVLVTTWHGLFVQSVCLSKGRSSSIRVVTWKQRENKLCLIERAHLPVVVFFSYDATGSNETIRLLIHDRSILHYHLSGCL